MSKQHRVVLLPSGKRGEVPNGTTLLEAARSLGVDIESICGGRQVCGKCLVSPEFGRFDKHGMTTEATGITAPDAVEMAYAERHGLDLNTCRLSCAAHLTGDAVIHIPDASLARKQTIRKEAGNLQIEVNPALQLAYVEVEPAELGRPSDWQRIQRALEDQHDLQDITLDPVLLPALQKALRQGNWCITLTIWNEQEAVYIAPGFQESLYGLAVDIGSTTLSGHLCDLRTGDVLATVSTMNPQVRYGEDLMSRVSYGMMNENGVEKMHRAVIKALNDLAKNAAADANINPADICELVLVGNTVMHHILLNIDPVELGGAPFALATDSAIDMRARDLGLNAVGRAARVHIPPCIAGHVGADNSAVLLAELPHFDEQVSLVVDIGTNAEILLGTRDHILSASSPTGPAFEGAQIEHGQRAATGAIERVRISDGKIRYKVIGDERWSDELAPEESLSPTGICGSGIIEVVAELFLAGLIDSGGLFVGDAPERAAFIVQEGRTATCMLVPAEKSATGKRITISQQDIRAIQLAKGALYAGIRLLMDQIDIEAVDRIKLAGGFGSYIDPKYAMVLGLIPDCNLEYVAAVGNAAGDGARIALLNVKQRAALQDAVHRVEYVETAVEARFQEHFVAAMGLPHATASYPHLAHLLPERAPAPSTGRRRRRRS